MLGRYTFKSKLLVQQKANSSMNGLTVRVNNENASNHPVKVPCLVLRFHAALYERTQRKCDQLPKSTRIKRPKSFEAILETRRSRRWLSLFLFLFEGPRVQLGGQAATFRWVVFLVMKSSGLRQGKTLLSLVQCHNFDFQLQRLVGHPGHALDCCEISANKERGRVHSYCGVYTSCRETCTRGAEVL